MKIFFKDRFIIRFLFSFLFVFVFIFIFMLISSSFSSLLIAQSFLGKKVQKISSSLNENLAINKVKKTYYVEAYWQVTRSDLKSGRLSQTETHKDIWEIKNIKDSSFIVSSSNTNVDLVGVVSTIKDGVENFDVLMMKEIDLIKLLGIDLEGEDLSKLDNQNPSVINVYTESLSIKDNNLSFRLPSEDYYEVRLELKI